MKTVRYIIAIIFGIVILSFYLPYCTGDGDAKIANTYNIKGFKNSWKWFIIWGIIIIGSMFIYSVLVESNDKEQDNK